MSNYPDWANYWSTYQQQQGQGQQAGVNSQPVWTVQTSELNPSLYATNKSFIDYVSPDMVHMIHAHWLSFPPMNELWHSIIGMYMAVLGVIALLGNSSVIFLMTSDVALRKTPSNMLIVNLAVSDWLMTTTNFFPTAWACFNQYWPFGALGCHLYGFFGALTASGSIFSLAFITRDRYNVIVHPLDTTRLTHRGATYQIIFIWLNAAVWCLAPFFGWNRFVPEGNMTSCTVDYLDRELSSASYVLIYAIWVYFVPLLTIILHYVAIISAVFAHERTLREQFRKMNIAAMRKNVASDGNAESKKPNKKQVKSEVRIAKIAAVTVFLWWLGWTPYLLIAMSGLLTPGGPRHLTPLMTIWGSVFAKASATYNPIVYALSHPRYRAALLSKFRFLACPTAEEDDDGRDSEGGKTCKTDGISHIS